MVWLYNHGPAPEEPNTREKGLPQPNPKEFVKDQPFEPIKSDEEVGANWDFEQARFLIFIRGKLHAVISDGALPGWCVLASKPGPMARQLEVT